MDDWTGPPVSQQCVSRCHRHAGVLARAAGAAGAAGAM